MEAGRELDKLVAEKIFGLVKIETYGPLSGLRLIVAGYKNESTGSVIFTLPEYSQDMNAAWEVVEKIKSLSQSDGKFDTCREPWVGFCTRLTDYEDHFGEAFGRITPLSICLAALIAVGFEV